MSNTTEFDEFDQLAQERDMDGAHRVNKKSHKWLIATILVILLSPLVGVGIGYGMSVIRTGGVDTSAGTSQQSTSSASDEETSSDEDSSLSDSSGTDSSEAAASDSQSSADAAEDAAAEVKKDAAITVLNGTSTSGLAAKNKETLAAEGFTAIETADYQGGDDPVDSTIYYNNADLEATAKEIGAKLGITALEVNTTQASGSTAITVVLRK